MLRKRWALFCFFIVESKSRNLIEVKRGHWKVNLIVQHLSMITYSDSFFLLPINICIVCVVIDVSLHLESKSCFNVYYKSLANLVVMLSLVVQVYICKPQCCKWNLFYLFGKHLHFGVHLCPCPLTWHIVLYNVNWFLQIESDFLKFFIFIWFQKYEPAFFLLMWKTFCFIT